MATQFRVCCALYLLLVNSQSVRPDEALTFEEHIRPLFRAHCFDCHGATEETEGSLDLRLVRFLKKGGDSGPAITAGEPTESLLFRRILSGEMPPGKHRVPDEEIAVIERWIASGAATARPEPAPEPKPEPAPEPVVTPPRWRRSPPARSPSAR